MAADPGAQAPRPGRPPSPRTSPLGLLCLLIALVLIRLPFPVLLRVVRWTSHHWCLLDATGTQAAAALAAVRQAAARCPGRAACLETSLAALTLLALRRRRTTWCIGTAADPYRFHAWIETEAGPVMATDEQGIDAFRRILTTRCPRIPPFRAMSEDITGQFQASGPSRRGKGLHPSPGGLCGVVFIGASAFLVRRIGVLLLSMASIAGQLTGSIALDYAFPSGGRSPSVLTLLGASLTFAAVWIAARRPRGTAGK
ncbi:hypothetical protein SFUMM280S_04525 [Streptomyces fumanus]